MDVKPKASFDRVLAMMECPKDNQMAGELKKDYDRLLVTVEAKARPWDAYIRDSLPFSGKRTALAAKAPVIYGICSLGQELSDYVDELFVAGNHIDAMLVNYMADTMLFDMSDRLYDKIREAAACEGFGIEGRYEAPEDIDIDIHRYILDKFDLGEDRPLELTSSAMLKPLKSMCLIYTLCSDSNRDDGGHDCSSCSRKDCLFTKKADSIKLMEV